ncbi:hypothetical protein GCM10008986_13950 [Salinibacillus aidingensis]|uniref:Uncharacterized protein n=2 Tax=Salinibacillus aidingensis TaxID=237684 RepID=A0ABN1B382_9BACI
MDIYATSFFAFTYGLLTDTILDLNYNLYGYFNEGFDWLGLTAIIMYFPAISFLFLNFYPFNKRAGQKVLYILLWSGFSISFEWLSLQTGFFYYNGWQLWYSAILYPAIFTSLIMNLKLINSFK